MTKPHIDDEINYVAEQLAAHMGIATHYDSAKDYLDGLISRVEDMVVDLENVRDDADGEE